MEKQRKGQENFRTVGKQVRLKDGVKAKLCIHEQGGDRSINEASPNISWKDIVKKVRLTNQSVTQKDAISFGNPVPFFGIQATASPFEFLSQEKLVTARALGKPDEHGGRRTLNRNDTDGGRIERRAPCETVTSNNECEEDINTLFEKNDNEGEQKISNAAQNEGTIIEGDGINKDDEGSVPLPGPTKSISELIQEEHVLQSKARLAGESGAVEENHTGILHGETPRGRETTSEKEIHSDGESQVRVETPRREESQLEQDRTCELETSVEEKNSPCFRTQLEEENLITEKIPPSRKKLEDDGSPNPGENLSESETLYAETQLVSKISLQQDISLDRESFIDKETHFGEIPCERDTLGDSGSSQPGDVLSERGTLYDDIQVVSESSHQKDTSHDGKGPLKTETCFEAGTTVHEGEISLCEEHHFEEEISHQSSPPEKETLLVGENPSGETNHKEETQLGEENSFGADISLEKEVANETKTPLGLENQLDRETPVTGVMKRGTLLDSKTLMVEETQYPEVNLSEGENHIEEGTKLEEEVRDGFEESQCEGGTNRDEEGCHGQEMPQREETDPERKTHLEGHSLSGSKAVVEGRNSLYKDSILEGETSFEGDVSFEGKPYSSLEEETSYQEKTDIKETATDGEIPDEGAQVEGQTLLETEALVDEGVPQVCLPPENCELSKGSMKQKESQDEKAPKDMDQMSDDGKSHTGLDPCAADGLEEINQSNSEIMSQIVAVIVEDENLNIPHVIQSDISKDCQTSEDIIERSEENSEKDLQKEDKDSTSGQMNENSCGETDKALEEVLMDVSGRMTFATGEELENKVAALASDGNVSLVESDTSLEDTQQSMEKRNSHMHTERDSDMQDNCIRDDVMVTLGQSLSPNSTFTDLTTLSPIRTTPTVASASQTNALSSTCSGFDSRDNITGSHNIPQSAASSPEKQLSELMRVVDELFSIHQDGASVEGMGINALFESGDAAIDSKNLPVLFKTPPRRPNLLEKGGESILYGDTMPLGQESFTYPSNSPSKSVSQQSSVVPSVSHKQSSDVPSVSHKQSSVVPSLSHKQSSVVPSVSHSYQSVNLPSEDSFGDSECSFQVNLSSSSVAPGPNTVLEDIGGQPVFSDTLEKDLSGIGSSSTPSVLDATRDKGKEDILKKKLTDILKSSRTKVKQKVLPQRETSHGKEGNSLISTVSFQDEKEDGRNFDGREQSMAVGQVSLGSAPTSETAAMPEIPVQHYGANKICERRITSPTEIPVPGFRVVPQYDIPEPVNEPLPISDEDVVPAIAMEVEILNGKQEEEEGVFVPPGSIEELSGDEASKKSRYARKTKKASRKKCANDGSTPVEQPQKRKRGRPKKTVPENSEVVNQGVARKGTRNVSGRKRKFLSEEEEIQNAAEVLTSLFSSDDSDWSWRPSKPGVSEQKIDVNGNEEKKGYGGVDKEKPSDVANLDMSRALDSESDVMLEQAKNGEEEAAVVVKNNIAPNMEDLLQRFEAECSADQTCDREETSKICCPVCKGDKGRCTCRRMKTVKKKRNKGALPTNQRGKLQVSKIMSYGKVENKDGPQSGVSCSYQLTFEDDFEEESARVDSMKNENKKKSLKSQNHQGSCIQKNVCGTGKRTSPVKDGQYLQLSSKENIKLSSSRTAKPNHSKGFMGQCGILKQPNDSSILKNGQDLTEAAKDLKTINLTESDTEQTEQLPGNKVLENTSQKVVSTENSNSRLLQQGVSENCQEKSSSEGNLKQSSKMEGVNSSSDDTKQSLPRAIVFEVIKDDTQETNCDVEEMPITFLQATFDSASESDPQDELNMKCSVASEPLRIRVNNDLVDEKVAVIVDNINRCSEDIRDEGQLDGKTQEKDKKDQFEEKSLSTLSNDHETDAFQKEEKNRILRTTFSPSLMKKYEQIRQISEKSRARRMKKYLQRKKACGDLSANKHWEVTIVDKVSEIVPSARGEEDVVVAQKTKKEKNMNKNAESSKEETISLSTPSKYSELVKNCMSPKRLKVVLTDFRRQLGRSSPKGSASLEKPASATQNKESDKREEREERSQNSLSISSSPSEKYKRNLPPQSSYYFFGEDAGNDSEIHHQKQVKATSSSVMQKIDCLPIDSARNSVSTVLGDEVTVLNEGCYTLTTLETENVTVQLDKDVGLEKQLKETPDGSYFDSQIHLGNKKVTKTNGVVNDVSTEEEGNHYTLNGETETQQEGETVRRAENSHQLKRDAKVISLPSAEMKVTSPAQENSQEKTTENLVNRDAKISDEELRGMEGDKSVSYFVENQPHPNKRKKPFTLKDILPRKRRGKQKKEDWQTENVKKPLLSKNDKENVSSLNKVNSPVLHQGEGQKESCPGDSRESIEKESRGLGQNGQNNELLRDVQEAECSNAHNAGSFEEAPCNQQVTEVAEMGESRLLSEEEDLESKMLDAVTCDETKTDGAVNDLPTENVMVSKEMQKSLGKDICRKTKSDVTEEQLSKKMNLGSVEKGTFLPKKDSSEDGIPKSQNSSESELEQQVRCSQDVLNDDASFEGLSKETSTDVEKSDDVFSEDTDMEKESEVKKLETADKDLMGSGDFFHLNTESSFITAYENSEGSTEKLPLPVKLRPCFVVLERMDLSEFEKAVHHRSNVSEYRKRKKEEGSNEEGSNDEGSKRRKLQVMIDERPTDSVLTEGKKVSKMGNEGTIIDVCNLKDRKDKKRKKKKEKRKKKRNAGEVEEKSKMTDSVCGQEDCLTDNDLKEKLPSSMDEEDDMTRYYSKDHDLTPMAKEGELEGIMGYEGSDKEDENNFSESKSESNTASENKESGKNFDCGVSDHPDGSVRENGEKADKAKTEKPEEGDAYYDDDCLSITAECTDLLSELGDEEMEAEPTAESEPSKTTLEETVDRLEYENVSSDDNLAQSPVRRKVQRQRSSDKEMNGSTVGNLPPQDLLPVKLMPRIPKKSTAIIAAVTSRNASQSSRNSLDDSIAGDDEDVPLPPSISRKLHPDIPTVSFAGEKHPGLLPPSNGESLKEHGALLQSANGTNAATSKQAADAGWQLTDKNRQKCPPGYCYKYAEFGKCNYGATCRFKHVLLQDIPRPEQTHGKPPQPSSLMQNIVSTPPTITESCKARILNSLPFPEEGPLLPNPESPLLPNPEGPLLPNPEVPLLPNPPSLGDWSKIEVLSSNNQNLSPVEVGTEHSSLPPLFPHEMEEFLTYIETCSQSGLSLQHKTSGTAKVVEIGDLVAPSRDDLKLKRTMPQGPAVRNNDRNFPAASRSNPLSVVHDLLRKKRVSDAWNVYRLKTQQEGCTPDRELLIQIITAFPSARLSNLKWKDCKEALKEFGRTFSEDTTPYCLNIIHHLCNSQEDILDEEEDDYEDLLPVAVGIFKDCVPSQAGPVAENGILNILSEKLIQESHWSLLGKYVSLQLNKGFKPSLTSVKDVISKYHVPNNHHEDLVNLMEKIDASNLRLPSDLYDSVKNCLAASSQYTEKGLAVLKMKGKFYPLDSIEKSLVEMCSVDADEAEFIETSACPEVDATFQTSENVHTGKFVDGTKREIASIIQKARDVDTLVELFVTIVASEEAHLLDEGFQECFAFTITKMAPSNHYHLFRKFLQCVVNDPRTGDAEEKYVIGIGKILFQMSWTNNNAVNAYQILETMSEYDEKAILKLFLARERKNRKSLIYGDFKAVISCYVNGCNILQACRLLNSLVDEEWHRNFWKKICNNSKWKDTILDLAKRLASAGYLMECLLLLRNFSLGMPAPKKSVRTRQTTKEAFNFLLSKSFEREEHAFALEQVFPAIQELSILDKENTILMVRIFASQGTPETTKMAQELYQNGLKENIYLHPLINESIHEGKVQVISDQHEISLIVQEYFRQSDKFLTGVYTDFKCDVSRFGTFVDHMKFRFLATVIGTPAERNMSSADAVVDETLMKVIKELAMVISEFNCQIETLNEKEKAVSLPPEAIKERFLYSLRS